MPGVPEKFFLLFFRFMSKGLSIDTKKELADYLGKSERSPREAFLEWPSKRTFKAIPQNDLDEAFIWTAVQGNAIAFEYIPDKFKSFELCRLAVSKRGEMLQFVPKALCCDQLYELAVCENGSSLKYVPQEEITRELAISAIENTPDYCTLDDCPLCFVPKRMITKKMVVSAVDSFPPSVLLAPKRFVSEDMLLRAIAFDPTVFSSFDKEFMTDTVINAALEADIWAIKDTPPHKKTFDRCQKAFNADPLVLPYIPPRFITIEMCLKAISAIQTEADARDVYKAIPKAFRDESQIIFAKEQSKKAVEFENKRRSWASLLGDRITNIDPSNIQPTPDNYLNLSEKESSFATEFKATAPVQDVRELGSLCGEMETNVYYISDIHIENQLMSEIKSSGTDSIEFIKELNKRIAEMLSFAQDKTGILLVAGDVANYRELTKLFYELLYRQWLGRIVFVAGNHELWDYSLSRINSFSSTRSVNEIMDSLSAESKRLRSFFLENAIYIKHKNYRDCVIQEQQILDASDSALREICVDSPIIILGGLGFSGLNNHFNAEIGLYRSAVKTLEEDRLHTTRFRNIYEKVLRCLGDKEVIVLTHTPASNWTSDTPNPNWVYINGHTHHNLLVRKEDGTTILSDAQIGYAPKTWIPHHFVSRGLYDPLAKFDDGIYPISKQTYIDFNHGRGIQTTDCNSLGQIIAIKRESSYMFVLKGEKGTFLLAGGRKKKLPNHNLEYYFTNLPRYRSLVLASLEPYYRALKSISKEVQAIGGFGTIHGCIVDISFYAHIYLDPLSGTINPYYALDIIERDSYRDLPALLEAEEPILFDRFIKLIEDNELPILQQYAVVEKHHRKKAFASVPMHLFGTDMYKPSMKMRSAQYLFEQNVVRFWNDDLLSIETSDSATPKALIDSKKTVGQIDNQ